jgi:hypothetical protein
MLNGLIASNDNIYSLNMGKITQSAIEEKPKCTDRFLNIKQLTVYVIVRKWNK